MKDLAYVIKEVSKRTGADIELVDQICKHVFRFTIDVMKYENDYHEILFAKLFKFKLKGRFKEDKTKQYLIKQSSSSGQEVLNEVLSSFIMKKINILPFVEYTYYIDNLNLCSKCENFINESTEFVPAIDIYESCFPADKGVKSINDILKNLKYAMKKNGLDKYLDMIDKMIAVDIILCNKDRHLNNFGFIKNIDSGEIIAFAPLFDFGASFLFKGERKINIFESYRDIGLKVIKKYGIVDTIEKNLPEIRKIINNYILLTLDEKEFIIRSFEKNLKS